MATKGTSWPESCRPLSSLDRPTTSSGKEGQMFSSQVLCVSNVTVQGMLVHKPLRDPALRLKKRDIPALSYPLSLLPSLQKVERAVL